VSGGHDGISVFPLIDVCFQIIYSSCEHLIIPAVSFDRFLTGKPVPTGSGHLGGSMPLRLVESIKQRPLRVAILNMDAELGAVSRTLADAGLCCEDFADGVKFVRALSLQCFDLAVLGRGGRSRDGRHVLRLMRRCLNDDIPVLFACPVSDEQYVTSILQAGADVYLNMPRLAQ
jgi:CheY-like chemotaxis protein